MEKTPLIRARETRRAIDNVIVESKLPSWMLRPIIRDIYLALTELENADYQNELKAYKDSLDKDNAEQEGGKKDAEGV